MSPVDLNRRSSEIMDRRQGRGRVRASVGVYLCLQICRFSKMGNTFLPEAPFQQQQMEASETDHCLIWLSKSNCRKRFQPLKVICIPLLPLHIVISSPADTAQLGIYLNGCWASAVLWLACCSPDATLHTLNSSFTFDRGKTELEAGLLKKMNK